MDANRCSQPGCCGPEIARRDFVRLVGIGAASLLTRFPAYAGPFTAEDNASLIPRDKKFRPEWVQSLFTRGEPEHYTKDEQNYVGMPVGGIACGQLYLGGDGRLWYWDIFRATTTTDYDSHIWAGPHYEHPMQPDSSVEHGFAIRVTENGQTQTRTLDHRGFSDITFRGEYPIGRVTYRDASLPVEVTLEAFSPFIPLDVEDSSLPATILSFSVRNTGTTPLEIELAGWMENAVCRYGDGGLSLQRHNRVKRAADYLSVVSTVEQTHEAAQALRPETVFEDFENGYGKWKVEGEAFGKEPAAGTLKGQQSVQGFAGKRLVNSFQGGDDTQGKLTSQPFVISRRRISFLIGGGNRPGQACINLIVDGKVVRTATGKNAETLQQAFWDVREFEGKQAHIEIVDAATGGWGHINVDQIVFTDRAPIEDLRQLPGYGSLALTLLHGNGQNVATADVGDSFAAEAVFKRLEAVYEAALRPLDQKMGGALAHRFTLPAGAQQSVNFALTWWFPFYSDIGGEMAALTDIGKVTRHYGRRFDGAEAVAAYLAAHFDRLTEQTRLWNKTWYDSTLPYWFLDRTFTPINTLATQTVHAFSDGRWWAWEGVDCCPGTCQHVWHYAQSVARVFPAIERDIRKRIDFGLAWRPDGAIGFRAENDRNVAQDGFCGTLMRVYREHQMSPNSAFLRRLWPRVRKSLEFIMSQDRDSDGLLEGEQMNTLDAAWYGPMAWISSLYMGALAAGAAMADEMNDPDFAARCRTILENGRRSIIQKLYNGEYFIHLPPDFTHTNTNNGCHSDQVLGQSIAWQLDLPRLIPQKETRSALQAIWNYNFAPDVGVYRKNFQTIPGGRWYAMAGEGGLIVCTWPHGGAGKAGGGHATFVAYFNESWTGFEYQVASHMIREGMITEGMAITRAVHDRYHPAKRNPYNEVECSDHYSRAMSGYGVFLAACGFSYHGPKGHIGFAPRLTPEDFRAPFTAAEGWGTYAQKREESAQRHELTVKWGQLRLRTLTFEVAENVRPTQVAVSIDAKNRNATFTQAGQEVRIQLAAEAKIGTGQTLTVTLMGGI